MTKTFKKPEETKVTHAGDSYSEAQVFQRIRRKMKGYSLQRQNPIDLHMQCKAFEHLIIYCYV